MHRDHNQLAITGGLEDDQNKEEKYEDDEYTLTHS